jgi:hypothetical protein
MASRSEINNIKNAIKEHYTVYNTDYGKEEYPKNKQSRKLI